MSKSLKVLHVDDDTDILEIAKMSLEAIGGFVVRHCASGTEALECAVDFAPDVFLLDFMMPQMNGEQLFAKLREIPELSEVPVIFMTARVQRSEIDAIKALGAIAVFEKPFDPMKLPEQISSVLASTDFGSEAPNTA